MDYQKLAELLQSEIEIGAARKELQDKIKTTILTVEHDSTYSTKELLKIYSLITSLSNCAEKERKKYVNKVVKLL